VGRAKLGRTHRGRTHRGQTHRGQTHRGRTHRGRTHRGRTHRFAPTARKYVGLVGNKNWRELEIRFLFSTTDQGSERIGARLYSVSRLSKVRSELFREWSEADFPKLCTSCLVQRIRGVNGLVRDCIAFPD